MDKIESLAFTISLRKKIERPQQGERELLHVLHVLIHLPGSVAAVKALSERDGCNLIKKNKERKQFFLSGYNEVMRSII